MEKELESEFLNKKRRHKKHEAWCSDTERYNLEQLDIIAYRVGNPINCAAIDEKMLAPIKYSGRDIPKGFFSSIKIDVHNELTYLTHIMEETDIVIGLGQSVHRMNKRGTVIKSFCSDDSKHTPEKASLYGAHNFFICDGIENTGVFIDFPGEITYDVGFNHRDKFEITLSGTDFDIYCFKGDSLKQISENFLKIIGKSYIPPKWAFGYQQSRWSYKSEEEIKEIGRKFRINKIPCDAIYLDIDYMERYKDFTVCNEKYPDFKKLVSSMKVEGFRLIPIIDAGVKIEENYDVYEEGVKKGYFCTNEKGEPFVAAVWPGLVHFPDFLNPEARKWFGLKYKILTDMGIDGFWNDMNEPAIFYTKEGLEEFYTEVEKAKHLELDINSYFNLMEKAEGLANNFQDYKRFYHNFEGEMVRHDKVHNLYGYNMTKSAAEGLIEIEPNKRFLLFSRASTIGMHRFGGIWTGDNSSWWEHIQMIIRMLPSINMCGFLYSGCDTGGFSNDASAEMIIRWTQFSIFTPLLRNHSVMGSRSQEPFSYDETTTETMRNVIELRYALIPYLYSEYMKAALNNKLIFSNLIFEYQGARERDIDNQILCGDSLMLAPIYKNNSRGRMVYLPEDMALWKVKDYRENELELMKKGDHYVNIRLDETPIFIKINKLLIVGNAAEAVEKINNSKLKILGFVKDFASYSYYDDDGITKDYLNGYYNTIEVTVEKTGEEVFVSIENYNNEEVKEIEFFIMDDTGNYFYGQTAGKDIKKYQCKKVYNYER
ncbi:MAG: alpha-glucosidase [Firmicutes bacterium HGW-Firmicutes-7]|nr:MAG: alpha-glucosidase [Firmicutes bacterium HGW-Firmicutes-7]